MEILHPVSYLQLYHWPKMNSFAHSFTSSDAAAVGSFPNLTSRCTLASKPAVRRLTPGAPLVAKEASWGGSDAWMSGENSLNTSCLTHYHTQASEGSRQGHTRLRTDIADTETGAVPFATRSDLSRLAEVPDSLPLWRCSPSRALSAVGDLPSYLIVTKFKRLGTTQKKTGKILLWR